jgi:hypothetical protein
MLVAMVKLARRAHLAMTSLRTSRRPPERPQRWRGEDPARTATTAEALPTGKARLLGRALLLFWQARSDAKLVAMDNS